MPVTEECREASKKFTKRDWQAIIAANTQIEKLTCYGMRSEQAEADGIVISWSNGSKDWYPNTTKVPKGTEVRLDANMAFLPISPKRLERIQKCLAELPLYCLSTEAWTKGEATQEEAFHGWATKQLERLERERQQEDNR